MRLLAPAYYPRFSCIAGACRHSCCIGWEIGIDEESYKRFQQLDAGSGRILHKIVCQDSEYAFKTDASGRCPFLNANGLCDLICEYGESVLCEICADHPRFRSFFENFTEIGLGASCEEAARIILENKEPFSLISLSGKEEEINITEDEEKVLSARDEWIQILEDESMPISDRIRLLFDSIGCNMSALDFCESADFLLTLERLDSTWDNLLTDAKSASDAPLPIEYHQPLKNLCVYFAYRHIPSSLETGDLFGAMLLCAFLCCLSCELFSRICQKNGALSMEDMISIARLISGEIEYSDVNTELVTERMLEIFE